MFNVFDPYLKKKRDHTKKEKKNDDVDIKIILSSTSEYDSTSLNLYLSSHTAFHLILFTISLYSYMLYIKQLHAYRAWNSTFYISFYHTY